MWYDLFEIFVSFVYSLMDGLNSALSSETIGLNINLKNIDINFTLFSEIPIFAMSLYDLVALIVFTIVFLWWFSILVSIIKVPLKVLTRWASKV